MASTPVRGLTEQALNRAKLSENDRDAVKNIVYYTTLILMLMAILAVLGVPISIITTVAGLIVVVIAIALQQSLGNLAATFNFQPVGRLKKVIWSKPTACLGM